MMPLSDRARNAPLPAKHARILVMIFAVRHVIGIALFAALTVMFYNLGGLGWMGMALGTVVYAIVAALNFRKLYRQYRRRLAAEAGQKGEGDRE